MDVHLRLGDLEGEHAQELKGKVTQRWGPCEPGESHNLPIEVDPGKGSDLEAPS